MMKICYSNSSPRCLIAVFCLAVTPCALADPVPNSDYSDRASITQRLQDVQSELKQHASDSDRTTHQLLKQLETTIYHHQAVIDFLAEKERQREETQEKARTWNDGLGTAPAGIVITR